MGSHNAAANMSVTKRPVWRGSFGTNEVPLQYKQPCGHVLMMEMSNVIYKEKGNREKIRSTHRVVKLWDRHIPSAEVDD